MKKQLFFLLYCLLFIHAHSQVNIQWQERYSSSGARSDKAQDMVMDAMGNVYVTGVGIGSSGTYDYVTIKYDASGVQQWVAEYNGPGSGLDEAHAIAIDASGENVYVTGWSWGGILTGFDYATIKYNSSGVKQWANRYSYSGLVGTDEAFDIGVDNAGNVYVTGSSDGLLSTSAAVTIKYAASGGSEVVKRYAGSGGIAGGKAIYVSPSGNVWITGYAYQGFISDYNFLTIKYNSSLSQQWAAQHNGPSNKYDEASAIIGDNNGNVYVTGYSLMGGLNNYDYATVKYDSLGNPKWTKNYNGTGNDDDRANAIKLDVSGDVYITGKSVGSGGQREDAVTLKYDKLGNLKWTARYNGIDNNYDEGKALFVDTAKNTYVTGFSNSKKNGNDYLTIKYDSLGVQQWKTSYNGTANSTDQTAAILVDKFGAIFITGYSTGSGSAEDYHTVKYCQFTADAGGDKFICPGASVALDVIATDAVSYSWSPTTGLDNSSIKNPIANPSVTTTYVVSVTNGSGCVDLDTVVVTIVPLPTPGIVPNGTTTFCSGNKRILTSAPAPFYKWNTSPVDTLQTITVNASGTYVITIRNSIGCTGTASLNILVNPIPVIDAGLPSSICSNTSQQLTASGAVAYQWLPGSGLNDSTIVNPIASPLLTTTYTVIGTAANGCTNKDSVEIIVLPRPTLQAGADASVCKNTTLQLNATAGYISYSWHPGKLLNDSTIANPLFLAAASISYTVTATAINGCSNTASIKLTALDFPTISAGVDQRVCKNTVVSLMASGAFSYVWSPGNLLKDSTLSNPIYNGSLSTTFTVTGTSAKGCINKDTIEITVLSLPAAPAIAVKADTLFCASGYASYQWLLNSISIPGATSAVYKYSTDGSYYVTVSDSNGCSVSSNSLPVVVGIARNESFGEIQVFPNPTTLSVTVQLELLKTRNVTVSIFNSSGQKIYAEELKQVMGNMNSVIDLKEYPSGAYYLQLLTDDTLISKKILKQ